METTVCISKVLGRKESRLEIEKELKGKEVYISSYTMGEIKNNVLQIARKYYSKINNGEELEDTFYEVEDEIWVGWRDLLKSLFFYLTRGYGDRQKNLNKYIKKKLEDLITDFDVTFSKDIIKLNGTGCIRASNTENEKLDSQEYINPCKKENTHQCCIKTFVVKNIDDFKDIVTIDDTELSTIKNNLTYIIENIEDYEPGKRCWSVGDAILCVEAPEGSCIYTRNRKHITPICDKLKKMLKFLNKLES